MSESVNILTPYY